MKTVNAKQLRTVTVLVRYFIRATQAVVLYVENDKGARYYVRLQENGVHTCNCKATKECYHIKAAINSEQARNFAAKSLPVWTAELVKTGKLVIPGKKFFFVLFRASLSSDDCPGKLRLMPCLLYKYLPGRRTKPPNGTALCLHKRAGEYTRA